MLRLCYVCVKGLVVATVRSSRACFSTGPLVFLLGVHYLIYRQSNRAAQRAQKYMTSKLVEDIDQESLQKLLGALPAWIKFDDFERARFVNQALVGMWGYLDIAMCTAIKQHVEPAIQDNLPFTISGFTFEKLSFGDSPFQIRGIKHASLYAGPGEPMALSVEVDASWVARPDIVAKLMPSKRFKLSHVDIRPYMYVKVDHFSVEGRLRLTFPLQLSLPIFNGLSIGFLTTPKIDMSLKMLGGVDIMSMPALQEWAAALISEHVNKVMTFPASIDISFTGDHVKRHAAQHHWPSGIATLELKTVHMPHWQTQACMPSAVLKPATWVDASLKCDVHAMTYPLVMDPQRPHTMEAWQASFPVFDSRQLLQVIIVENLGSNRGYPLTAAPIPLSPLFSHTNTNSSSVAAEAGSAHHPSRIPSTTLGLDPLGTAVSGPVLRELGRTSAGLHRAKSDSQLTRMATRGSQGSADSEEARAVVGPPDLEGVLQQSLPKSTPTQRNSFAEGEQRAACRTHLSAPESSAEPSQLRGAATRTGGGAGGDAQGGAAVPAHLHAGASTSAENGVEESSCAPVHQEAASGVDAAEGRPPARGGPWKGLGAIFRRRPPSSPPAAMHDSDAQANSSQQSREAQRGARAAGSRRAAEDAAPSSLPSVCSTPDSPFGEDRTASSSVTSPRSAGASAQGALHTADRSSPSGQWSGEQGAWCAACGAPLLQAADATLLASLSARDGSIASMLASQRRSSGAMSDSPSLREWTGLGGFPQHCSECARRSSAAPMHQRTAQLAADDDERWGPWFPLDEGTFAAPMPPGVGATGAQAAAFVSAAVARPNLAAASSSHGYGTARRGPAAGAYDRGLPHAPSFASAAEGRTAPSPLGPVRHVQSTADLDWEGLWGGPCSAWNVSSKKRSRMPTVPPTCPPTLTSASSPPSHMSTKPSQDGLSDLGAAASLDTEHTEASHSSVTSTHAAALRLPPFPPGSGPPLVARSRAPHTKCEVPMWLPDARGTAAALGPGGAYIIMRPLRQRSWYKHLDVRWQTDILQLLPHSTVMEIKRCAAAILVQEAASGFSGPHPLIRSYNLHGNVDGQGAAGGGRRWSQGGSRKPPPHMRPAALVGLLNSVLSSVFSAAAAPMLLLTSGQKPDVGMSHLPPDIESNPAVHAATRSRPETALKPDDVQLEANAGTGAVQFRGFAGALKTHLQWLPLQWTYLARGDQPPPVARAERAGLWLTSGVLLVRLMCTTVYKRKMQRPQVVLQLDHVAGRQEVRRTGVRERWAKERTSLHQGTVEWELKFSFCVEVEGEHELACSARRGAQRCLQVEVVEVEASLRDRMRAYWIPDADGTDIPEDAEASVRDAACVECLGLARVPLAKLVRTPNKPCQAVWQLVTNTSDSTGSETTAGTVTLETCWLPACKAEHQG